MLVASFDWARCFVSLLFNSRLTSKLFKSCKRDARKLCDSKLKELDDDQHGQVFGCLYRTWKDDPHEVGDQHLPRFSTHIYILII